MMITCGIEYIITWVGLNVCEDWHGMPVKCPLLWSNVIMLNYFLIIYIEQKGKDE